MSYEALDKTFAESFRLRAVGMRKHDVDVVALLLPAAVTARPMSAVPLITY